MSIETDEAAAKRRATQAKEYFENVKWDELIKALDNEDLQRTSHKSSNKDYFKDFKGALASDPGNNNFLIDCWKIALLARRAQENKPCW